MMTELFKRRAKQQQRRVFGYFKYIFNDHFVVALMFLLGALAFQYAKWLQTVPVGGVPMLWIVSWVLGMSVLLLVGTLATFVDGADIVFLLPAEDRFVDYMRVTYRYSLVWPSAFLTGVLAVSWPFLTRIDALTFASFIELWVGLLSFKWGMLLTQAKAFEQGQHGWRYGRWVLLVVHAIVLFVALQYQLWIYPVIGVGLFIGLLVVTSRTHGSRTWQWEQLIDQENRRQQQVDALLSLFVDVPHRMMTVKRRQWADRLLTQQTTGASPYPFLYARTFWRQNFWVGLWARLTLVTAIIAGFLPAHWLSLAIIALLIVMNGMQLLPLMNSYDRQPLLRIYPNTKPNKAKDSVHWLGLPLAITAGITILVAIWHYRTAPRFIFDVILVTIATVILYLWIYLPMRYRKRTR
ncbi:MAG: ABC transporter permease [Aerococcus sp.]|nr:ABC transporter permease [Aerococcus sp.]